DDRGEGRRDVWVEPRVRSDIVCPTRPVSSISMSLIGALALAAIALAIGGALGLALRSRDNALREAARETSSRLDLLLTETASAREASESVDRRFGELRHGLEERVQGVERNLAEGQKTVAEHLGQMREKIGMVFEASQKIEKLATGMTRLEDLLKPPKLRGALGETFLEQALGQVLPAGCW